MNAGGASELLPFTTVLEKNRVGVGIGMVFSFCLSFWLTSSIQLAPQMGEVFASLLKSNQIQIVLSEKKRIRFLGEVSWDTKSDLKDLQNLDEDLLYLVALQPEIDIAGINLLNEECLWPQISKKVLNDDQQKLGDRIHIVRLHGAETMAFVISLFEDGRIAEIPLRNGNWLYIKNAAALQKQFLKKIFGYEDLIFVREELYSSSICEVHSNLQTFAEELQHWIDYRINIPYVGSKVFGELRIRESLTQRPSEDSKEIELMDYQLSEVYKSRLENQLTAKRASVEDLVSQADLEELMAVWNRGIRGSLDYAFIKQWETLYSYLNDPIEIRGKWAAARVLIQSGLSDKQATEALFDQHFPSYWFMLPRLADFWQELIGQKEIPVSKGLKILSEVQKMKWPEGFEELAALYLFQTKKIDYSQLPNILSELNDAGPTDLSFNDQLLLLFQIISGP